jgi:hypothetical protein
VLNWLPLAERLVWPRLVRPRRPIVYLDLNHFIGMARAIASDPSTPAGYRDLFDATRAAIEEQRIVIPLSGEHLFEMAAIKDPKQRTTLADVMEVLSGFQYLLGRPEIAQLEIEAGIEAIFDEQPQLPPVSLIGPTFGWAFGMRGGMNIVDAEGDDASAAARKEMGAESYEEFMRDANYTVERAVLVGPSDEEIQALRADYGYVPEVARESHKSRLEFELDLCQKLADDSKWRRGRLRDVVSAREIAHEWLDAINRVNNDRARAGRPVLDVDDVARTRQFMTAMPHTQVAISIKTRYHRDPTHRWTANDITDIDALSVAYAYCDAVFTDKAARAALTDSKDLRSFRTVLPRTPGELTEWIEQRPRLIAGDFLVPHPPPR